MNDMLVADCCTVSHAAGMIGVSPGRVRQLMDAGVLDVWQLEGGLWLVGKPSVERYLTARKDGMSLSDMIAAGIKEVGDEKADQPDG